MWPPHAFVGPQDGRSQGRHTHAAPASCPSSPMPRPKPHDAKAGVYSRGCAGRSLPPQTSPSRPLSFSIRSRRVVARHGILGCRSDPRGPRQCWRGGSLGAALLRRHGWLASQPLPGATRGGTWIPPACAWPLRQPSSRRRWSPAGSESPVAWSGARVRASGRG